MNLKLPSENDRRLVAVPDLEMLQISESGVEEGDVTNINDEQGVNQDEQVFGENANAEGDDEVGAKSMRSRTARVPFTNSPIILFPMMYYCMLFPWLAHIRYSVTSNTKRRLLLVRLGRERRARRHSTYSSV